MDLQQLLAQRIPYTTPGMDQIIPQHNLVYKTVDETPLLLDVYHPPAPHRRPLNPAVIFVHGNWPPSILPHVRALGQTVSWAQLMAAHGLTAITFQHRTTQRHTHTAEAASDVAPSYGVKKNLCAKSPALSAPCHDSEQSDGRARTRPI